MLIKIPVLLLVCAPLLALLASLLRLFNQQPDSFILAFTQTYKMGLSQLDYMCENVSCGGHYLCSVAAMGHRSVVKPQRLGVRQGSFILCNQQLLVSNAFEEKIAEIIPKGHKCIRRNYDKVGDLVHQYYWLFEYKYFSDFIYYLMKPAEWIFWIFLQMFDQHPANRIALQYLPKEVKLKIKENRING